MGKHLPRKLRQPFVSFCRTTKNTRTPSFDTTWVKAYAIGHCSRRCKSGLTVALREACRFYVRQFLIGMLRTFKGPDQGIQGTIDIFNEWGLRLCHIERSNLLFFPSACILGTVGPFGLYIAVPHRKIQSALFRICPEQRIMCLKLSI